MNRAAIIEEMQVMADINPTFEIERRVDFIKGQLATSGIKTLVLGISGGIDSAVCGRLAQLAVNQLNQQDDSSPYKFIAVRLPYGVQLDEHDAQASIDFIQPSESIHANVQQGGRWHPSAGDDGTSGLGIVN